MTIHAVLPDAPRYDRWGTSRSLCGKIVREKEQENLPQGLKVTCERCLELEKERERLEV